MVSQRTGRLQTKRLRMCAKRSKADTDRMSRVSREAPVRTTRVDPSAVQDWIERKYG